MSEQPRQGTIWQHIKTGGLYMIFPPMTLEADETPLVAYQTMDIEATRTDIWVRPRGEFLAKFRPMDITISYLAEVEKQRTLERMQVRP